MDKAVLAALLPVIGLLAVTAWIVLLVKRSATVKITLRAFGVHINISRTSATQREKRLAVSGSRKDSQ